MPSVIGDVKARPSTSARSAAAGVREREQRMIT
jgi:hypothetical protein